MYFYLVFSSFNILSAQTDSTKQDKFQLKFSLNYSSSLNYYGRVDSLKSASLIPVAEIWYSQFYVNASPIFIYDRAQPLSYAGTVTSAGYEKATDKAITSINIMKPFMMLPSLCHKVY